jgi:hypothetical protein
MVSILYTRVCSEITNQTSQADIQPSGASAAARLHLVTCTTRTGRRLSRQRLRDANELLLNHSRPSAQHFIHIAVQLIIFNCSGASLNCRIELIRQHSILTAKFAAFLCITYN